MHVYAGRVLMQLFTTAEAAAYLRLKERKMYEMVAEGFRAPFQKLVKFIASHEFAARPRELGGYDIAGAGAIRYSV